MDQAARIAFIQAMSVGALARIEGMKAENKSRERAGQPIRYHEEAFEQVPIDFGLGHNQVLEYLRYGS